LRHTERHVCRPRAADWLSSQIHYDHVSRTVCLSAAQQRLVNEWKNKILYRRPEPWPCRSRVLPPSLLLLLLRTETAQFSGEEFQRYSTDESHIAPLPHARSLSPTSPNANDLMLPGAFMARGRYITDEIASALYTWRHNCHSGCKSRRRDVTQSCYRWIFSLRLTIDAVDYESAFTWITNDDDVAVFEKTYVTTQKTQEVMFFGFWKKNVKNVKKRTYSFTGHLITPGFNTQIPEVSTGSLSHQHQTSCSEMRTQETMPLRTVCDKRLSENLNVSV